MRQASKLFGQWVPIWRKQQPESQGAQCLGLVKALGTLFLERRRIYGGCCVSCLTFLIEKCRWFLQNLPPKPLLEVCEMIAFFFITSCYRLYCGLLVAVLLSGVPPVDGISKQSTITTILLRAIYNCLSGFIIVYQALLLCYYLYMEVISPVSPVSPSLNSSIISYNLE